MTLLKFCGKVWDMLRTWCYEDAVLIPAIGPRTAVSFVLSTCYPASFFQVLLGLSHYFNWAVSFQLAHRGRNPAHGSTINSACMVLHTTSYGCMPQLFTTAGLLVPHAGPGTILSFFFSAFKHYLSGASLSVTLTRGRKRIFCSSRHFSTRHPLRKPIPSLALGSRVLTYSLHLKSLPYWYRIIQSTSQKVKQHKVPLKPAPWALVLISILA